MTQSMTGFASTIVEIPISKTEHLSLSLNLKTLNSRYFDITCKLPYLFSNMEVTMHRLLKKKLERGHIYLTIKIQHDATQHVVIPALKTIKEYLKAIKTIQKACDIQENISLSTILQLPNILQVEEELLSQKTEEKILQTISMLADDLILTRLSEGKTLADDIAHQIKNIEQKLQLIKQTSQQVYSEKKDDLEKTISSLQILPSEEISVHKSILEQHRITVLTELEKVDIHEEVIRAQAHVNNIQQILNDTNSILKGKKLDFTLQELNREINTIASKCSHSVMSSLTIDMKTDIEKSREQAQNIL